MSVPFSAIVTPTSLVFTTPDGKPHDVTIAHPSYGELRETIKELQTALRAGDRVMAECLHQKVADLVDVSTSVVNATCGNVEIVNGIVRYRGQNVHNSITERILWGATEGMDMTPYMRFLDKLMNNPSKRSVDQLYGFIEKHRMGIADDGDILAYKVVKDDYRDIYSSTFDNSPGQIVQMVRNRVDDDPDNTCSQGLHVCAFSYLSEYGTNLGLRIVICKVSPADVVSIPSDGDSAKMRCCRYEVVGEYKGADRENILARQAVIHDWDTWDTDYYDLDDAADIEDLESDTDSNDGC